MLRRVLKTGGTILFIALGLALYREWVIRNTPLLFLPLGFSEQALPVTSPEEAARNPSNWIDPVVPAVLDDADFEALSAGADVRDVDVLVTGGTMGAVAAATAAADDGLSVALVSSGEWDVAMAAEAAEYVARTPASTEYRSDIESDMRRSPSSTAATSPQSVASMLSSLVANDARIAVFEKTDAQAFGRGAEGRIDRALLRGPGKPIAVRFDYLIDATREGSTLARAGAGTRSSWDSTDDEGIGQTPPAEALEALASGYTMSGRTIPGIGKRLEGGRSYIAVLDRGFNGWFAAPAEHDECWAKDPGEKASPFIKGGEILRTRVQGCNATVSVSASFTDTVELFWINHGNDTLSATVFLGPGNTINITKRFSPTERFVRLGAFPAGPGSDLSVTIRSTLPTDKLEGLIARGVNAGYRATSWNMKGGASPFRTNGWERTAHDVYISTDSADVGDGDTSITVTVDGFPVDATAVGEGTYLASNVVLSPGNHEISASVDGDARVTAVPVAPSLPLKYMRPMPQVNGSRSWTFTAETDAPILIATPAGACPSLCHATLAESGSVIGYEETTVRGGDEGVSAIRPLFMAYPRSGKTYVLRMDGGFDAASQPFAVDLEQSAALFAAGQGTQKISPSEMGNMYDIWIRPLRSPTTRIATPSMESSLFETDTWNYVSTELLNDGDVEASGGYVQLLAVPNTLVDAYHVPLSEQSPASIDGLPPGRYAVRSFGAGNPGSVSIALSGGRTVNATFRGDGGMYFSDERIAYDGSAVASMSAPWAQILVLHEPYAAIREFPATTSGVLLPIADAGGGTTRSAESMTYLFDARTRGIGPVTIATLGKPETDELIRAFSDNALALLRRGAILRTKQNCLLTKDPTCDPRRYVRATSVFPSSDGTPGAVSYPEGRRLVGTETLSFDEAYALRAPCAYCATECIAGTTEGAACVRTDAINWNQVGIVSVVGTGSGAVPTYSSPLEERLATLPSLLLSMRRDGLLPSAEPTYFESVPHARDVMLTLGMFVSAAEPNVLAANTTLSATHGAAAAVRTPSASLAIGEAIGHAVAYAHAVERSDLAFVMRSPTGMDRLRRYLVDKGVRVVPIPVPEDDPLLLKAMQRLALDGDATITPTWSNDRLSFAAALPDDMQYPAIPPDVRTVKDALNLLAGQPETDVASLQRGVENGFIDGKMLRLPVREILGLPVNDSLRVKLEYLLRSR